MNIWITKHTPYSFVMGGADRSHIHFDKPYFKPEKYVCCFSGAVTPDKFGESGWISDNRISLRVLRKTQSELFERIWNDICSTYRMDMNDIYDVWSDKQAEYHRSCGRYKRTPGDSELNRSLWFYMENQAQIYAESFVEKENLGWRTWVGEYEIDEWKKKC